MKPVSDGHFASGGDGGGFAVHTGNAPGAAGLSKCKPGGIKSISDTQPPRR